MGTQNSSIEVEFLVIQLYTKNLSSVGIVAGNPITWEQSDHLTLQSIYVAVIAGIDFTALNNIYFVVNEQTTQVFCTPVEALYQISYTISLILSIIVMVHAIFAVMFGPKTGLLGNWSELLASAPNVTF